MKKSAGIIAVLLILVIAIGFLPHPANAEQETEAYPIEAVLRGTGDSEVRYDTKKLADTVFYVENRKGDDTDIWQNASFLFDPQLRIIINLPDGITVSELYNGKGDPFDLTKPDAVEYENNKATISIEKAYDSKNYGYHSRSGCFYIKLSNGILYTLVCDSSATISDWDNVNNINYVRAPQSVQLYNVDADYFYEEYEVTDLQVSGRSISSIVYMSLSSDTPIRLKAQATYYAPDAFASAATSFNQNYRLQEACYGWAVVNGEKTAIFPLDGSDMSSVFTLKPGLNVVEVYGDTGGFCTAQSSRAEWFQTTRIGKSTHNNHSVVYLIDYSGESADLSDDTGSLADLDLNAVKVFSFMLNKGPLTEKQTLISEESIAFSLPETSVEIPTNTMKYYERGVILYLPPMNTGARVEVLDETDDESLVSGEAVGFLHAINPSKLGLDGTFKARVTAENGNEYKIYTFRVNFASNETSLTLVSIQEGTLDEDFHTEQEAYLLNYTGDMATLEFALPEGASLSLDGETSTTETLRLSKDADCHTVTVTAADGLTKAVYYFITQLQDDGVPYFSYAAGTVEQINKLLAGYRNMITATDYIGGAWPVFMAKAAANDLIEWDGKYIEDLESKIANNQATDPARNILEAVLLGENPYHFDPNGDGEYRNFVEELYMWRGGGAWANNIWYAWAAKAVGLPTLFDESLKSNAISRAYDLDMRGWTVAALLSLDGMRQKDMVPYVESLKNVQVREDNPISDLKYTGLWRMVAHYSTFDTNAYTIGTVLSAIGAAGVDPDRVFAVTASDGTVYEPLDQIEKWLWEEETGTFMGEAEAPERAFVKDMIIGLGDILQGSNVWNRCALTEEKFNDLAAKASDSAKAAALSAAELTEAPDFGGADYGKYYYFLYEAVADELEESGDTSMRPKVIWDTPVGQFRKAVAALPAETEDSFVSSVADVIELYEKLYAADGDAFTDAVGTDTMTAYRDAVAAALEKQDGTGDTADFYKRVMALPDALLITEDSREEVDALRALYDGMTAEQRDLIDWAGASVLLRLQAAEAALGQGSGSTTMTIHFALLGAPDDGPNGTVNTLKDGNLDTWLEDDYTFNAETISAEQAFRVIMGDAGISWKGGSSNSYGTLYVSAVKNPATGEWMEEFTTGENSGWMYTVNGLHPNMGLSAYMLADGDSFVFHYTDDFTLETDPWDGTIINDEEKTGATTVITDAATGTFVVECDRACAVLAKTEDGNYVLLPATVTPGADGDIVSFTAGDYDEVLIRVKGDLNGDGAVDSTDTLMMKKLVAGLMEPDEITALLMDLTGDGIANSTDTLKMKRVAAGLDTLAW